MELKVASRGGVDLCLNVWKKIILVKAVIIVPSLTPEPKPIHTR